MKFKLRSYFTGRIPLVILRRNNVVYFQTQIDVARADGYCRGKYIEKYKTDGHNIKEVGILAAKLLKRFEDLGDLSIAEFEELVGMEFEQYKNSISRDEYLGFFDAKDYKDLDRNYDHASIEYIISENKYKFNIWWYDKSVRYITSCDSSQGEKGILTFDTPLEFTDYSDPEKLGEMIIEALDRSRQITDKAAGNPYPSKDIEIISGAKLTVSAPRDKHFTDDEDHGVGELYQAYMYFPREDSEESSAEFYLGIAAELDCDMSEDNIRNAWEELHGKAEFFEVKAVEYGIFKLRAEMRNKSVHRISYMLQIGESELLDCTIELHKPNSRKKLDEKLSALFVEFAGQCRFKF